MTKREKLMHLFSLDEHDATTVKRAAEHVWNEIAFDMIQGIASMEEKDPESVTISRADVMEVVMDAGRLEEEILRRRRGVEVSGNLARIVHTWSNIRYDDSRNESARELIKILVRENFTSSRYGL
jgi:hypothetical protein